MIMKASSPCLAATSRCEPTSPTDGGYDFAADPDLHASLARVFWLPEWLPDIFSLHPTAPDPGGSPVGALDLTHLPGIDLHRAPDGTWHGLWRTGSFEHRFQLPVAPPATATGYFVALPLHDLAGIAARAAMAFWRATEGRPPATRSLVMTAAARERHVLILRALDGRRQGVSLRDLAEALLGFRGSKEDWEQDTRRNEIRRIVARGRDYVRGGYRKLLFPPTRRRRR